MLKCFVCARDGVVCRPVLKSVLQVGFFWLWGPRKGVVVCKGINPVFSSASSHFQHHLWHRGGAFVSQKHHWRTHGEPLCRLSGAAGDKMTPIGVKIARENRCEN